MRSNDKIVRKQEKREILVSAFFLKGGDVLLCDECFTNPQRWYSDVPSL